ncbi:MAG: LptF/LptG family permease [Candidatus Caldatribacterium sp.]|nr:LptF/LptG family permease [Candidatus Caldatribacterium sp.]
MHTLDRYVIRQTSGSFLFGVFLFVAILSAGDLLFRLARMWLREGLPGGKVVAIFFLSLPQLLVYVLPMALLLGILLVVGRMAGDSEVVALRASGVSLFRFFLPFFLFSLWVCAGTIVLQEVALPLSALKLKEVWEEGMVSSWPVAERTFFRDASEEGVERLFYVREVDARNALLEGVVVQEYTGEKLRRIINAERARVSEGRWVFENGVYYEVNDKGEVERVVRFAREEAKTRETMEEILKTKKRPQEMSFSELRVYVEREKARGQDTKHLEILLWHKTAIPFAAPVFALIGVALGVTSPRSGKALGIGLSILVVFGYYVLFSIMSTLAEGGVLSPLWGTWVTNVIGALGGGMLLWKRNRI